MNIDVDDLRTWRSELAGASSTTEMKLIAKAFYEEYCLYHLKEWEVYYLLEDKSVDEFLRIWSKAKNG